ncbi:Uncharacterised protein [Mycobacteroides abscessus subsp. abscessus]|nr:Uncharacterised protein [Mycobacteroides abscessus subsp. abscessus]
MSAPCAQTGPLVRSPTRTSPRWDARFRGPTSAVVSDVPAGTRPQMLKPSARICSRPSSVIFSGPHGGIHTQLMR